MKTTINNAPDVILIGAGIMSATLGTFFNELQPDYSIEIFERLDAVSEESSDAMNNAGTGHSALCELNYTPEKADGTIDTSKAIHIIEQFEVSKQFWSSLLDAGKLKNAQSFIQSVPHMSFVLGEEDAVYLKKRYEALQKFQLFQGMEFSDDPSKLKQWIPLVMKDRDPKQKVAATHMALGTDVNFGALTRELLAHLNEKENISLNLGHEVKDIRRLSDGKWQVTVKNMHSGEKRVLMAKFVFIGAGGGSLHLLQKSGIPEAKGFGGFPVGGQWLVSENPELIAQHNAKVYGKASVGAPPMSVPHLDTRVIGDKKALLFGPFAGFSTKFLKQGSYWDLFETIKCSNIAPMMKVGMTNFALVKYLVQQLRLSFAQRVGELRDFVPSAKDADWRIEVAGQRVQIIKNDPQKGGILQFGTEVVTAADGSISALLGASPGASTSVSIMLKVLEKCFPEKIAGEWGVTLKKIIPSYGQKLEGNAALTKQMRDWTSKTLQLNWTQPEA